MATKTLAVPLLFATLFITAHAEQKPVTLHFKSVGTLMLVDVRINGQPKAMVFDSGAQRTALNAKSQHDHVLTGIIDIEHNTWFNFPIILTNMTSMFSVLGEGDGVLGQDFMRQFKSISIDYKTSTIILVP